MAVHEIFGAILASIAVILTIYVFKRTLDFQSYREIDSNYMEVLRIGIDHPYLRDKSITKECKNYEDSKDPTEKEEALRYDQYAFLVWNIIESIFDRNKVDKTWYPAIKTERELHLTWFEKNWKGKFKEEFHKFIKEDKNFSSEHKPPSMALRNVKQNTKIILIILVISSIPIIMVAKPSVFSDIEFYFDRQTALECAKNPKDFSVNASECSKFSLGSIAELCVQDYNTFGLENKSGCKKYIPTDNGSLTK